MGRVAPKKYKKMDYFEKQQFTKDQAERRGIDLKHKTVNGRHEMVDWDASNAAVARAMANDYDTRRSIEAAQLAGNKKAEKLGNGISNISEAVEAERFMAKTHKNRIGATGKYSSANDEGNVTNYWVNKDRKKFAASIASNNATDEGSVEAYEAPERGLSWNEAKERGTLSDQAQEADSRVTDYRNDQTSGEESKKRYTQQGAFDYLSKYKLDLTDSYVG